MLSRSLIFSPFSNCVVLRYLFESLFFLSRISSGVLIVSSNDLVASRCNSQLKKRLLDLAIIIFLNTFKQKLMFQKSMSPHYNKELN